MRRLTYTFILPIFAFTTIYNVIAFAEDAPPADKLKQVQEVETPATAPTPKPAMASQPQPASQASAAPQTPPAPSKPFVAFTGKVSKNKVRMRLQSNLESPVIKELAKDDLVVVVGESDDFYAVQPPQDTKAYIFRTFVLDNVVEGNRVNIRLEPNTEAPVIGQLNQGDRVQGIISPLNSKWLEINTPANTRFYIAKEFVEKVGDPSMVATVARRREEVNRLLNTAYLKGQDEMKRSFEDMHIDDVVSMYQKIISDYFDFPDQSARAKELLKGIQEAYLQKKVVFLENKTKQLSQQKQELVAKAEAAAAATPKVTAPQNTPSIATSPTVSNVPSTPSSKGHWLEIEQSQYSTWKSQNSDISMEDYYEQQKSEAIVLKGVIEPNNTTVKNRPGDYLLINPTTQLPVAYLYSTSVDLHTKIGKQVTIQVSPRPNHHFAFPAYFVLSSD